MALRRGRDTAAAAFFDGQDQTAREGAAHPNRRRVGVLSGHQLTAPTPVIRSSSRKSNVVTCGMRVMDLRVMIQEILQARPEVVVAEHQRDGSAVEFLGDL